MTIKRIAPGGLAARNPSLRPGLVLTSVQGQAVAHTTFGAALGMIKRAARPLTLTFKAPPSVEKDVRAAVRGQLRRHDSELAEPRQRVTGGTMTCHVHVSDDTVLSGQFEYSWVNPRFVDVHPLREMGVRTPRSDHLLAANNKDLIL